MSVLNYNLLRLFIKVGVMKFIANIVVIRAERSVSRERRPVLTSTVSAGVLIFIQKFLFFSCFFFFFFFLRADFDAR